MATTNRIICNLPSTQACADQATDGRMTLDGTLYAAGSLLTLLLIGAVVGWQCARQIFRVPNLSELRAFLLLTIICIVAGWCLVVVTIRRPEWATKTAPVYAVVKGLFLGSFSAVCELRFPGIIVQALSLTVVICTTLLIAYGSGWIRVTESFNKKLSVAISAVALFYLVNLGMALVGVPSLIARAGIIPSIILSVITTGIAAMSLISDFDSAVQYASTGARPKYLEWYAAFGILLSLIWIYFEVLNLITKAREAEEAPY